MTSNRLGPAACPLVVTCLLAGSITLWASAAAAETVILESPVLRLEVETEPYTYAVIAKASGAVLLRESATTFTAAPPVAGVDAGSDAPAAADDAGDGDAGVDARRDAGDAAAADAAVDAAPPVARALRVVRALRTAATADSLAADLVVEGSSDLAQVSFRFVSPEVLEVSLGFAGQAIRRVQEQFHDQGEHVFGIWEYPFAGNLDNRGVDEDYLGLGSETGSLYTSARAPFYVTSRGYGVYVRTQARGRMTVAREGRTGFWFDEARLTYAVIYGPSYYDVLARYTALAGAPMMPPLWAFGAIWWHDDFHRDLRGRPNAQANVIDLATQLQAHRIPATGLLIDRPFGTGTNGWGNFDWAPSFPDPKQMVADLDARGLNLVLWIANRAWNGLYTEGRAQGWLFPGSTSLGPALDLRIPAAYAHAKAKLAPFVDLGAKGWKIDRGEQGEHPDSVQNENVTLYARLAQEALAARHGNEAFLFTRNVADRGRQHTAVWNGDSEANFTGLRYSIAAGLRSGIIVMPMWGSDTGGYLRSPGAPNEEVFARWFGFSAFSPMMEVLVGDGHTPWYDYSPALVEIARKHSATHHDLIPYTRSFMHAATQTGAPVMRPMIFEAGAEPDADRLVNLADQYLFGSELLVAPVVSAGATARAVQLPQGLWLDYGDRRHVGHGPGAVLAQAPLDVIPVFVREGAIVPRGDILRGNDNWTPGWAARLRIEIFPARGDLARSFAYYTGSGTETITADTRGGQLTVAFGPLGHDGVLELHVAAHGKVMRNGAELTAGRDFEFDAEARRLRVPFTGATTLVVSGVRSVFTDAPTLPEPGTGGDAGVDAGPRPAPAPGCSQGPGRAGGWPLAAVVLLALVWRWRRCRSHRRDT